MIAVLVSWLLFPDLKANAEATSIRISTPDVVGPGETFVARIDLDPKVAVAGIQFDINFDPAQVTPGPVTEGELLTDNDSGYYFIPGKVSVDNGTIEGIVGVLTGSGRSIATPGTVVQISFTAGPDAGVCPFSLSNVIAGDVAANAIPLSVVNSEVAIVISND